MDQKHQEYLENLIKERTEELEEQKEMYRTLSRLSPVGIFRIDGEDNCVYVNKKWREITGMTQDQARGKGWKDSVYFKDREEFVNKWNDCFKNKKEFNLEYRLLSSKGILVWVLGQANLINGGNKGYVGAITDITNKKELLPQILEIHQSAKARCNNGDGLANNA